MKKIFTTLCCLFVLQFTFAQKIVGYIDGSLANAETNAEKLQWNKLTDIIFGFIQPTDNNGNFESVASKASFEKIKSLAASNNVKFHFSAGGANSTIKARLAAISANETARNTFAKNVADILAANNMDGFDLDWEFPTAAQTTNHVLLLKALRDEFDKRGKGWTLAIAVGGETPSTGSQGVYHTDYISSDAFQYLDYLNLMSYDIGLSLAGNNHSSLKNALDNINDFAAKGCPKSKMILGVPFYGRATSRWTWKKYSDIASADPAAAYGADALGGQYYNGKKTLQDKVDLIMKEGGIGIMIWEITYDRLGDDPYSLLSAIHEKMAPYQCDAPQPNLGAAISICGTSSVTLNTNISNTAGLTFTWKNAQGQVVGSNKSTYSATKAGKYTVDVFNGKCTNTGNIEVLGTLPTIDLGAPITLCDPATATLDAQISGNGITFSWEKDSQVIDKATSSTLTVDRAATYKVTASATGCTSSTSSVDVTSELINVEHKTLACKGSVTFTITDDGSYEWYDSAENGTKLNTGKTFTTNATQTTTFYVQKLATQRIEVTNTGCDGLDEWVSSQSYAGGSQVSHLGIRYNAKFWANANDTPAANTGSGKPWEVLGPCLGISCKRTPVTVTVGGICTSIFDISENSSASVTPNPVENQATINFTLENSTNVTIDIINTQGQLVKQQIIGSLNQGNQSIEINTNDLGNGIYICKIITDNKILTAKFSK